MSFLGSIRTAVTAIFRRGDDRLLSPSEKGMAIGFVFFAGLSLAAEGCGLYLVLSLAMGHTESLSLGALFGVPSATGWLAVEVPLAWAIGLLLVRTVIAPVQNYFIVRLTQTVAGRIRDRVLDLAAGLPAVHAGGVPSGELTSIVMEHGARSARAIAVTIQSAQAVFAALVAAALLVARDPGPVLAGVVVALPAFAAYALLMIRTSSDSKRVVDAYHHGAGAVTEGLRSLANIKAVGGEGALRRSFGNATLELKESEIQLARNSLKMAATTLVVPVLGAAGIVLYAMFVRGASDAKTLTAILLPIAVIGSRIASTAGATVDSIYQASVQATSFGPVDELIAKLRALAPSRGRVTVVRANGGISAETLDCVLLRDIGYRLPNGTWLFRNLNHRVAAGAPLILRGKSGTGKSTLASLISGANEPTEGEVRHIFAGREERPRAEQLNYLSQEPAVIAASVRTNLLLGAENEAEGAIGDTSLIEALRAVDLWSELEAKGGLDAIVYEGGRNLSGGQIRRLGLARLLARDRAIWIFDEAMASLDVGSAEIVTKLIRAISARAATIVISHDVEFALPGANTLLLAHGSAEDTHATTGTGGASVKLDLSA